MNFNAVYVSWVDLFVFIILMVGIRRGQKRGFSEELLDVAKWVTVLVVAGFGYELLGDLIASSALFSLLYSYLAAYLLLTLAVVLLFSAIRRGVGDKLIESDAFGSGEYPLGMLAGGFRYATILVVLMSLLNARHFTAAERSARTNYHEANFGKVFFPSMADLQVEVFGRSYAGMFTRDFLYPVLITPTAASDTKLQRSNRVRAREQTVNEILER